MFSVLCLNVIIMQKRHILRYRSITLSQRFHGEKQYNLAARLRRATLSHPEAPLPEGRFGWVGADDEWPVEPAFAVLAIGDQNSKAGAGLATANSGVVCL
jgi:hypothetical protein